MCHSQNRDALTIRIPLSRVTKVKITNRKDCCQDRLATARVSVNGVKCGLASSDPVVIVRCDGLIGSLVTIDLSHTNVPVNVMEVQIYGKEIESKTKCVEDVVKNSGSHCAKSADVNCDGITCNEVGRKWGTPSLQECMSLCRNNEACNYISYTEAN